MNDAIPNRPGQVINIAKVVWCTVVSDYRHSRSKSKTSNIGAGTADKYSQPGENGSQLTEACLIIEFFSIFLVNKVVCKWLFLRSFYFD